MGRNIFAGFILKICSFAGCLLMAIDIVYMYVVILNLERLLSSLL